MSKIEEKITDGITQAKAWYYSKGILGGVIQIIASALMILYGVDLNAYVGDIFDIVQNSEVAGAGVVGIVGAVISIYGRIKARTIIEIPKFKK